MVMCLGILIKFEFYFLKYVKVSIFYHDNSSCLAIDIILILKLDRSYQSLRLFILKYI